MKNRITMKKLRAWKYGTGATDETVEVTLPNGETVQITYKDCSHDNDRNSEIGVTQHMRKGVSYDNTMYEASNAKIEEYTLNVSPYSVDVITIKRKD